MAVEHIIEKVSEWILGFFFLGVVVGFLANVSGGGPSTLSGAIQSPFVVLFFAVGLAFGLSRGLSYSKVQDKANQAN